MSFTDEFAVVDLIMRSDLETNGVDAFVLSLIKAERQIRRLFTYVIYQCPAFGPDDVSVLRDVLVKCNRCYFEGFERGINALCPYTIASLIGSEYIELRAKLDGATAIRNKVFHGQLTCLSLSRADLLEYVVNIRRWCELLTDSANREIGYDGFMRDSFQKGEKNLAEKYRLCLPDISAYAKLLDEYVKRPSGGRA